MSSAGKAKDGFEPIVSSNLEAASFDPQKRTMIVKFKNGTAYEYLHVPPSLWSKFQATFDGKDGRSAGKFFAVNIRGLQAKKLDD